LAERKRFYEIARSSLVEVDNHLEIAITLNYLDSGTIEEIDKNLNELFAKLSKFIERAK
jgi:four helix bundle protein